MSDSIESDHVVANGGVRLVLSAGGGPTPQRDGWDVVASPRGRRSRSPSADRRDRHVVTTESSWYILEALSWSILRFTLSETSLRSVSAATDPG